VKNGVPYDVAHALPEWELLAHAIVFAQLENGHREWDWQRMTFVEQSR
jgi:hypothetical protein